MPIHTMGTREMAETRARSHWVILAVVVCAAVCVARGVADDVSVVSPVSGRTVRAAAGRVLVRFRDGTDATAVLSVSGRVAGADLLAGGRLAVAKLAAGADVEGAVRALKAHPSVLAAEPDYVVRVSVTPNDTLWDRQCGLRRLRCPSAWDVERGRPGITVAILDTGVAYDHPDLAANLRTNPADPFDGIDNDGNGFVDDLRGWDFADNDHDPHADRGDGAGHPHGTHVAGIAAAVTNNSLGIAGVGWSCSFLPVRVLDESGIGYLSDLARGIEYATDQGVAVINLSLEGPFSHALQAAIDYAYGHGVVVCAAAGNGAAEITADPATWVSPVCNDGDALGRDNHVIGVASIDCNDHKLGTSNYGGVASFIDLAAPGANVRSTYWPGHTYADVSGTSQATPHVAGAAALLAAHLGAVGPGVITELLKSTAVNIDGSNPAYAGKLGAGRPHVAAALGATPVGPIVAAELSVDDEAGPGVEGNGNGRAEPSEVVKLRIALRNLGTSAAQGVACHLQSGDPRVVVRDADATYGEIAPGQAAFPQGAFRLKVRRLVPAGTSVPLTLQIAAGNGGPWQDAGIALPVGWDALGEPDDTCADAFLVDERVVYEREVGSTLDQDWFLFDGVAGKRYIVAARSVAGSAPDTLMSLRDVNCGRELARNDDGGVGDAPRIIWACPTAGRYAAMVTSGDSGWTGAYGFQVRISRDAEIGPVSATTLVVDDDNRGASAGDADGRAEAGEAIELMVELANGGPLPVTGVSAVLSSPRGGVTVLSDTRAFPDMGPGGTSWTQEPFVVRLASGMGEPARPLLEFRVTSDQGVWDSELTLVVGRSEYGEPDDDCRTGALIAADGTQHVRRFEQDGDRDWFLFDAVTGGNYTVRAHAREAGVDPILTLQDRYCGRRLAYNDSGGGGVDAQLNWTCPQSGRYALLVWPAPGSGTGLYDVSLRLLTNIGPAEPDDTCAQAVPIPTDGTPQLRDFAVPGDEDWIAFDATRDLTYAIETTSIPDRVPATEKLPPDGTPRSPDTILQLCNRFCSGELAADDDGGEGLFSRIVFTPERSGTYHVRVTEFWDSVGPYQIRVWRNHRPSLTFAGGPEYADDLVSPDAGTAGETRFLFKVVYTDPDGDPPTYVHVRLKRDGVEPSFSPLAMRLASGGPGTGAVYVARRRLPAGEYWCKAVASDGVFPAAGEARRWTPEPVVIDAPATAALISSVAAVPARAGIQVAFTLHASALVSARILNLAGRPVKTLCSARDCEAGTNTLLWNAQSDSGLVVPNGTYLVEVMAKGDDGAQTRALVQVRLDR